MPISSAVELEPQSDKYEYIILFGIFKNKTVPPNMIQLNKKMSSKSTVQYIRTEITITLLLIHYVM